jgi:hypothetical protein
MFHHSDALFEEDNNGSNAAYRACLRFNDDTAALQLLRTMYNCRSEFIYQTPIKAYKHRTYLHLAAEKNWDRVVEWLLERNVSMEVEDDDGKLAWEIAFENYAGVVMSVFAVYHVVRQNGNNESRAIQSERDGVEGNKAKGGKVERIDLESKEIERCKVGVNAAKSNEIKDGQVRRHWFRVSEGSNDIRLVKYSDLSGTLGGTNKWTFKLFTISENKASSSQLLHYIDKC